MQGAYEIQSYCLGHTDFVSCSVTLCSSYDGHSLLLTGGGDGTVRLWDPVSGQQLDSYIASEQQQQPKPAEDLLQQPSAASLEQQQQEDSGSIQQHPGGQQQQPSSSHHNNDDAIADNQEDIDGGLDEGDSDGEGQPSHTYRPKQYKHSNCAAVLSLAVSPSGTLVAVAVEGDQELQLLQLDGASKKLSLLQRLLLPDVINPCAAAFASDACLWVVGGPLVHSTQSAHVGVAQRGEWQP